MKVENFNLKDRVKKSFLSTDSKEKQGFSKVHTDLYVHRFVGLYFTLDSYEVTFSTLMFSCRSIIHTS